MKICLPTILQRSLDHQAQLARQFADEHQQVDFNLRRKLADEMAYTAAMFRQFVAGHKIRIEKRKEAPKRA